VGVFVLVFPVCLMLVVPHRLRFAHLSSLILSSALSSQFSVIGCQFSENGFRTSFIGSTGAALVLVLALLLVLVLVLVMAHQARESA
jgi:hypothetical protein